MYSSYVLIFWTIGFLFSGFQLCFLHIVWTYFCLSLSLQLIFNFPTMKKIQAPTIFNNISIALHLRTSNNAVCLEHHSEHYFSVIVSRFWFTKPKCFRLNRDVLLIVVLTFIWALTVWEHNQPTSSGCLRSRLKRLYRIR